MNLNLDFNYEAAIHESFGESVSQNYLLVGRWPSEPDVDREDLAGETQGALPLINKL